MQHKDRQLPLPPVPTSQLHQRQQMLQIQTLEILQAIGGVQSHIISHSLDDLRIILTSFFTS